MATNPILGELNNLSPGAKAALAAAHGAATSQSAAAPPPKLITDPQASQLPPAIGAHPQPSAPPPMPASAGAPSAMPAALSAPPPTAAPIAAPRGSVTGDTNELGRVVGSGSGISQIHSKIENSDFGQNHPLLGKILGWGAQIPATLADVAGSAVAPMITANLPGTEYHHDRLIKQDQRQLAGDVENQDKQAMTQEAQARTSALENPPDTATPLATDQGYITYDPKTHQGQPLMVGGQQAQPADKQFNQTPEELAFQGAIKGGMQPLDAYRAIKDASNVKDPSLQQQYLDALASGDTKKQAAIAQTIRATSTEPKIEIKQTPIPGAGNKQRDAQTEKEYAAASKDMNTQFATAQTQLDSIGEAKNLINSGAVGQALGVVKTMVGLAGGKGSGVRITQAELNSLASARGIQGDFQGWLNKLGGKGNLSGQQVMQINAVLSDAENKLNQKRQWLSDTLDKLGEATTPQEIRQIQSEYRHQTMQPAQESGGSGKSVSLKAAMGLPVNKGKSEADVRKDIESHGHTVAP